MHPFWNYAPLQSMPNIRLLTLFLALQLLATSRVSAAAKDLPSGFTNLEIGDAAPAFSLPGVDGKTYSLEDFKRPKVLMVLFTGTHCPVSHGVEKRLQALVDDMEGRDFGIVAINPNHASGLRPDELGYTAYLETFEDSRRYARDLGWKFPFLYDGDQQVAARAYGCLATPHVFIFDRERKLRYNGRFDDSRYADPTTVTHHDARDAIEALLADKPVPVEKTRPFGCSTKWKERSAHVAAEAVKWNAIPATIEEIDAEGAKRLRKNGSEKLRLINVWATWCAPCVQEFPDLTATAQRFSRREFELITISLDEPGDKAKAEAFLGKHRAVLSDQLRKSVKAEGRSTNNYLYVGANVDALAEALDPQWSGALPFSVLIDQRGKVLYRVAGKVDPDAVISKVLETISPYYKP
jgi:peroxiredoxin